MSAYSTTTANLPEMPTAEQWPAVLEENRRALGDKYAEALAAVYEAVQAGDVEAYGEHEMTRTELRDRIFREAADLRRHQVAGEDVKLPENSLQRGSDQWKADQGHTVEQEQPEVASTEPTPEPDVDAERPTMENIFNSPAQPARGRFDLTKAGMAAAAADLGRRAWKPIKPHMQVSREGLTQAARDIGQGSKVAGAAALVGAKGLYKGATSDWLWRPERKHYDVSKQGLKEAAKHTLIAAREAGKVTYKAGRWTAVAVRDNLRAANERYAAKMAAQEGFDSPIPDFDSPIPDFDAPPLDDLGFDSAPSMDDAMPDPQARPAVEDFDVDASPSKSHDVKTNLDSGWNRL